MNFSPKRFFLSLALLMFAALSIYYLLMLLPKREIIGAILIHLLAGTLVAFVFLYLVLVFLRPKIAISPYICYRDSSFWFKIVNMSMYHAFDIKIELFKMVPLIHSAGNSNVDIYNTKLKTSDWTSINRYRRKHSEKDPFSLFAQLIFTQSEIEQYLSEPGTYLELQITARHGLTGLADRFTQQFPSETVIKKGHKFCFGSKLGTMNANQMGEIPFS